MVGLLGSVSAISAVLAVARPLAALLLAFAINIFAMQSVIMAERTAQLTPTVNDIVDKVQNEWDQEKPERLSALLKVDKSASVDVDFNIYNSSHTTQVIYRDNCVASPWEHVIDCDLKLIDDLISDYHLVDIYGGANGPATLRDYQKNILMWVLSHELGHVALRHGVSDYEEDRTVSVVFDPAAQKRELDADAFAIRLVGNLATGSV
jgi:hypothetical protein